MSSGIPVASEAAGGNVNKRAYGILAGIIASAVSTWLIRSWAMRKSMLKSAADRERGEVIFDNTPTASNLV